MRSSEVLLMLLAVLMLCSSTKSSQLEIEAFQPAVVPIRAITTLTLKTNVDLNVTSNTSLKCRFKDISVPARIEEGFIFCDTPPVKNTDRVSVHLDVDGKLVKTKKPLYFHEPFKVSNITPSVVSPAQHVHLTISGISCKEWMQYFVRFQTANGTKKTQQGICRDSVVSCFVPEFPPNTVLRVGLTLSNKLVEWADSKIIIQYPVDAIKSFVKDIATDFTKKGAFTFVVVLKDRFKNPIKVTQRINKNRARISVQYSAKAKPQSLRFLKCTTTVKIDGEGDEYMLSCDGAENEDIYFYPSINNVPLGGQEKYEAITTLCPGKNSCKAEPKSSLLAIVLSCVGAALVVSLVSVLIFVRHKATRKRRVTPETTEGLEMEVTPPENEDRMRVYEVEDFESDNSYEEKTIVRTTQEDISVFNSHSRAPEETELDQQTEVLEEVGSKHQLNIGEDGKNYQRSKEKIEMKSMQVHQFENGSELSANDSRESAEEVENKHQLNFEENRKNYQQSKEKIEMKSMETHQFENGSELSANDSRESAGSSPLSEALLTGVPCSETMSVTEVSSGSVDIGALVFTDDGANVSSCKEQCMDGTRGQTTKSKKRRPGMKKVLPIECELVTRGHTKYTDKFKEADKYKQAWVTSLLGKDESHVNKSEVSETSGLNTEEQE